MHYNNDSRVTRMKYKKMCYVSKIIYVPITNNRNSF